MRLHFILHRVESLKQQPDTKQPVTVSKRMVTRCDSISTDHYRGRFPYDPDKGQSYGL